MANRPAPPPIVLFGYDSSAFTQKTRLALHLRQIPYTFINVPSMMPRPVLLSSFNLTYRKIPVLAIGKEVYADTSLILEIIAQLPSYPPSKSHPALYPSPQVRALGRMLASHYTDRPLFRLTCGLMPQAVWETSFGIDRAGLIGHELDPKKLGAKIPRNLAGLDTYLSILEPLFVSDSNTEGWKFFLGTEDPSGADVALFYQLDWGFKISAGDGIDNLTAGGTSDGTGEGMTSIFNSSRYPGVVGWYERAKSHFYGLYENSNVETRIETADQKAIDQAISILGASEQAGPVPLMSTAVKHDSELDRRSGLEVGVRVSVAPDDTGRDDPTLGILVALSTEEVVIVPDLVEGRESRVQGVRVHFPRVGFVVRRLKLEDGPGEIKLTARTQKARL